MRSVRPALARHLTRTRILCILPARFACRLPVLPTSTLDGDLRMPTPSVRTLPDVVDVAVVGYGYWGPNLVRNLAGLDTCNLRAICDLHPAARARATHKYPAVPVTADLD